MLKNFMREGLSFAPAERQKEKPLESVGPATAQVGKRGMFYLGERFDYTGEAGRLCRVPAKYKEHEIFKLDDRHSALVNPETGKPVAILSMPADLWSKDPDKSYYPFDETEIQQIDLEKAFVEKDIATIKLFANFKYTPREERREQRAEARLEIKAEQIMRRMAELGIVEEKDGLKIWDKEKLKEIKFGGPKEGSKYQEGFLGVAGKVSRRQFFDLLKNESGVLTEEYDKAKSAGPKALKNLGPRQIFYDPKNLDEAFSPEMIKSRVDTIGYWDVGQLVSWSEKIKLESGEEVGLNEMALAKKIYGDLNGRRDENGTLNITDENGASVPVSAQKLKQWVGQLKTKADNSNESSLIGRPVEYVTKTCPELQKRGLLLPSDFRAMSGWQREIGKTISPISSGGTISIESQQFYVKDLIDTDRPGDFGGVKLSDNVYAVVERKPSGQWEIVATCKSEKSSASKYHKKENAQFKPYKITEENMRLPDESAEDYAERIRQMADYGFVTKTAVDIATQTEIPIKDSLSWREQQWLATALHEKPKLKDEVVANTKKFGTDFLRTFLSCEYDTALADKIVSVASSLDSETAKKLFQKYGDITKLAENLDESLLQITDRKIDVEKRKEIRENVLRRAKNLLIEISGGEGGLENLSEKIESIKSDMVIFCSFFRALFKGGQKVDFSEIRGLEFINQTVGQMDETEKEQMLAITKNNYTDEPQVAEEMAGLLKEKDRKDKFFILKKRDQKIGKTQVVAFVRCEQRDGGRIYVGGFNVQKDARGSAIGEQMIKHTLEELSQEYVLEAVAVPELPAGTHYVEGAGFVGTGYNLDAQATGTFNGWFKIELDKKQQPGRLRGKPTLELLADYEKNFAGADPLSHVGEDHVLAMFEISYDVKKQNPQQMAEFKKTADALLNHSGYRMTRYICLDSQCQKRLMGFEKQDVG